MSDNFLDEIVEKFGEAVLIGKNEKIEPISTGCLSLDASIGIGGVPSGRITIIQGPEGAAKTTLALSIVRTVVHSGKKALYVDVENMLDLQLVNTILGEKIPEGLLTIITPDTAEDALAITDSAIKSGEFDLVILDSVGALAPREEKEKDFDDFSMTLTSRLVSKFIRRTAFPMAKNKVAVVIVNQVRDKIGAYVKTYDFPGGHALKHAAAVIIQLSKSKDIKAGDKAVGILSQFVIKKNKLAPPFRSYFIPVTFGKGIDFLADAVNFCEMLGVIKKSGSYYSFEDEKLGQGLVNASKYLGEHKDTLDKIKERVYNIVESQKVILEEELEEGLREEDE